MARLTPSLLIKYLANECTAEEYKAVTAILDEYPADEYHEVMALWLQTAKSPNYYDHLETELDWIALSEKMRREAVAPTLTTHAQKGYMRRRSRLSTLLKATTVFVIAVVMGLFTYLELNREKPVTENVAALKKIEMPNGKRGRITLSDGTKVYLNSGSSIEVPSMFVGNVREVKLEGEAYFEVTKNPNRPLVVKVNDAEVRVLGTKFAVRNYREDNVVRTVVESGAVSFKAGSEKEGRGMILTAGKLGLLDLFTHQIKEEEVEDMDLYLSWKDGFLKFEDAGMTEVARQLERKYDLEISFADKDISNRRLSAEFKSKNSEYVLQTISKTLGLAYKQEGKKVTFSRAKEIN